MKNVTPTDLNKMNAFIHVEIAQNATCYFTSHQQINKNVQEMLRFHVSTRLPKMDLINGLRAKVPPAQFTAQQRRHLSNKMHGSRQQITSHGIQMQWPSIRYVTCNNTSPADSQKYVIRAPPMRCRRSRLVSRMNIDRPTKQCRYSSVRSTAASDCSRSFISPRRVISVQFARSLRRFPGQIEHLHDFDVISQQVVAAMASLHVFDLLPPCAAGVGHARVIGYSRRPGKQWSSNIVSGMTKTACSRMAATIYRKYQQQQCHRFAEEATEYAATQ